MALFGYSSATGKTFWSQNSRRKILHRYPQGKAPMTYLLSMADGKEETDKPEFSWWEKRDRPIKSATATSGGMGSGGNGPFANAANDTSSTASGFNMTAGTVYTVYVADASIFRVYDVVHIRDVPNGAGSAVLQVRGVITALNNTSNWIQIRADSNVSSVSNDTDANGVFVYHIGSAAPEGARSVRGGNTVPCLVTNYTQIHRNTVGPFTRTSLKNGLLFDKTGVYKEALHETSLRHMKGLELSLLKGQRNMQTVVNENGDTVPVYQSGGIEWFCRQWDKQNVSNGGAFDYVPDGADLTSVDWRTQAGRDKRYLEINGSVTPDELELIFENALTYTDDSGFKKVMTGGQGFYGAIRRFVDMKSYTIRKLSSKETYGLDCSLIETPWGDLPIKTHPLLNEDIVSNWDGYILDLGNIHWRPLQDSDTELLTNRQNNDDDGRKDEWLTEGGYEIWNPETHMVIKGLTGIVY